MTERDRGTAGTYRDDWFADRYQRYWEPVLAGPAFELLDGHGPGSTNRKEIAMTTEQEAATDEARRAGSASPADRLLERLADLIGARATVQAVFGDPVRHEGLTVIPVARVRWGFGGGGGRAEEPPSGPASGSGGGGGVAADPVGYLEIGPDGAAFRPIPEPYPSPLFLLASGLTAAIVLRALARLIRG